MKKMIKAVLIKMGLTRVLSRRSKKRARRFVDPSLSVEEFFRRLNEDGVSYAVLRWFDILPQVEEGEDLDILVADEDLPKLEKYLTGIGGHGQKCDIYTVSGLPGTSFRGIAYYPLGKAANLLGTAVLYKDNYRVPDAEHHFFSLAYHALYHKGFGAGLPGEGYIPPDAEGDHDYAAVLEECARAAGIAHDDFTLEGLDRLLDNAGWKPPHDALEKLSGRNRWIREHFFSEIEAMDPLWKGFTLFVVREEGLPFLDDIKRIIQYQGFDLLGEAAVDDTNREEARTQIRGGNWGRGPWPRSGGYPAWGLAVWDALPIDPDDNLQKKHPGLKNSRIMSLKLKLRDYANGAFPASERCNIVHSADNAYQALHYADILLGKDKALAYLPKIKERTELFHTPYPLVRELSRKARIAKTEVIEYKGGEAVSRTFRPGREEMMAKEVEILRRYETSPFIPELLEEGDYYYVYPFYKDILNRKQSFKPLFARKAFWDASVIMGLKHAMEELDWSPGLPSAWRPDNLIWDEKSGMKFIPTHHGSGEDESYSKIWFPKIGLSLKILKRVRTQKGVKARQFISSLVRSLSALIGKAVRKLARSPKRVVKKIKKTLG